MDKHQRSHPAPLKDWIDQNTRNTIARAVSGHIPRYAMGTAPKPPQPAFHPHQCPTCRRIDSGPDGCLTCLVERSSKVNAEIGINYATVMFGCTTRDCKRHAPLSPCPPSSGS